MEVGDIYGRLTLIKKYEGKKSLFRCECGNIKMINIHNVEYGRVKSCGCLFKEGNNKKHGDKNERLYHIWKSMRERCNTPSCRSYYNYGGRGIGICSEWDDYLNFKNWAINNGYSKDLTIDRINVDGNYEPSNCRWVTMKQQGNNKRTNVFLTYNGKTMTMTQWAEEIGIDHRVLWSRLNSGWSVEKALTQPIVIR